MHRRTLAALALALLLVSAGCAGFGGASTPNASASSTQHGGTIQVAATGQASASPNVAVLYVTVTATADDAAVARKRMDRNVSRVRSALRDLGLAQGQMTTVQYDLRRDRHRRDESAEPRYRASHTLRVTLTNLSRVGPAIDTAVANGATGIERVQYTLSAEKRRSLRQAALEDAMANARAQATVLAEQAGLTITTVARVQTTERGHGGEFAAAATPTEAADSGPRSGTVSVSVRVVVTYNATTAGASGG